MKWSRSRNVCEEAAEAKCTKPKWSVALGASQSYKHRHRPECAHTELPLPPHPPPPPHPPSFIFPGLALTATWASFHSGLGCGACSWETLTAGPVSQNKAWVLDREGERHRGWKGERDRVGEKEQLSAEGGWREGRRLSSHVLFLTWSLSQGERPRQSQLF